MLFRFGRPKGKSWKVQNKLCKLSFLLGVFLYKYIKHKLPLLA